MSSNVVSLRKEIWNLLEDFPSLTAKDICKHLKIDYKQYRNYVTKEKSEWKNWKYYNKYGTGSKCSSVRRTFYGCSVFGFGLDRGFALGVGWVESKNRNRHLFFRDGLGRIQWFESGTVVLYVRKPSSEWKAKQLFCNGFTKTGLISDMKVLDRVFEGLRIKGGKADYDTDQKLPYLVIKDFKKTNGITVILGDRSHPKGVHVLFEYQNQVAKADLALTKFFNLLNGSFNGKNGVKPLKEDYSF